MKILQSSRWILFAWLSEIRAMLYKLWSFIYANRKDVRITFRGNISIKANLHKCALFGRTTVLSEAQMGEKTYGTFIFIHTTIGKFCSLGPGCKIGLGEHDVNNYSSHPSTYNSAAFVKSRGRSIIEDHVWLGANVIVRQGEHIGKHAAIGAGSVVTEVISVGRNMGVLAKFIRKRWQ